MLESKTNDGDTIYLIFFPQFLRMINDLWLVQNFYVHVIRIVYSVYYYTWLKLVQIASPCCQKLKLEQLIPLHIRGASSKNSFKKMLKTHISWTLVVAFISFHCVFFLLLLFFFVNAMMPRDELRTKNLLHVCMYGCI